MADWGYLTISCHLGIPAKADLHFGRCNHWADGWAGSLVFPLAPSESILKDFTLIGTKLLLPASLFPLSATTALSLLPSVHLLRLLGSTVNQAQKG